MRNSVFCPAVMAAVCGLALPGVSMAGGELQAYREVERTVTTTGVGPMPPMTRIPVPQVPAQPYRFCPPYPYTGPGRYPCSPPPMMTHYAPTMTHYAPVGVGACRPGPSPFLTGALVGIGVGALIF